jgi:hypothetical protein
MKNEQLKPGQPCSHPGCRNHIKHPCEGCGRYAAGIINEFEGSQHMTTAIKNSNTITPGSLQGKEKK